MIAEELWRWQTSSTDHRAAVAADGARLSSVLEYFLGRCFQNKNSARSSGWWCDGFYDLSIRQLGGKAFHLSGIAYWAEGGKEGYYLAPCELEFHYASAGDLNSSRIIVRFGQADEEGKIIKRPLHSSRHGSAGARPRRDSQWAFAIELN